MEFIIELDNVTKRYKDFTLDHISFRLPRGMIYGMIGENGAGKSTCIHAITDLISIDEGNIRLFGENYHQHAEEIKQKIGVVLDGVNQIPYLKCKDMDCIMKKIYKNWDSRKFFQYLKTFQISQEKKVKDLSKGMQVHLPVPNEHRLSSWRCRTSGSTDCGSHLSGFSPLLPETASKNLSGMYLYSPKEIT